MEEHKRKNLSLLDDILALDSVLGTGSASSGGVAEDIRVHGLMQEVEELRKANRLLQEEKE